MRFMNKNLQYKWTLKITWFIISVVGLYQIIPYFTTQLVYLTNLYDLIQTSTLSNEFKFLLVLFGLYVTIQVLNLIVNICWRFQNFIDKKYLGEEDE